MPLVSLPRRRFWKMTGSGNDFVFFDARAEPAGVLETSAAIAEVCDRRMGIGADGVVFLESATAEAFSIRYFNRDGSLAELCGNASLCAVTLSAELGIVTGDADFTFGTTSGPLTGRLMFDGPEIDSTPVRDTDADFAAPLSESERRIGFARVGVPHLVLVCDQVEQIDVVGRGRHLRHLPQLSAGANVNFVGRSGDGWSVRTYERGVEDETLACGTGAVAAATLLERWGLDHLPVRLVTRSGAVLTVRLRQTPDGPIPALKGEGRLVFEGSIRDLATQPG